MKVPQQTELVDENDTSQVDRGHDTVSVLLTGQHKDLDTIYAMCTTGGIKISEDISGLQ